MMITPSKNQNLMRIPNQTPDDRRNEIIRLKQNIEAVQTSGHFNQTEQDRLLPFYKSRLKELEDLDIKEIPVHAAETVK